MKKSAIVVLVGACALAVGACKRHSGTAVTTGQVIARIGDQVVTTYELDAEFRAGKVPPEAQKDPATTKHLLHELVLRKYLVQEALRTKLDREPGVLAELLRSREQVLASAYVNRTLDDKPVNMVDVVNYIKANPEKFDGRVVLTVDEIVFTPGPELETIVNGNKAAKSLEEIDKNLTVLGVAHRRSLDMLSVGEMPADLAAALREHKGSPLFARLGGTAIYAKVLDEQSKPLSGKAAEEHARQELKANAMKGEIATTSAAADQEAKYEGVYASMMRSPSPSPSPSADEPSSAAGKPQ